MLRPLRIVLPSFLPSFSVIAYTLPRPNEPTNSVPLSPHAICRAASTPEAYTSILKPGCSLIFLISEASSASEAPVGGPDGGARPFCVSVSSPRNQSSGGWVQNSLLPDW